MNSSELFDTAPLFNLASDETGDGARLLAERIARQDAVEQLDRAQTLINLNLSDQ